ncbi:MAG TPA: glycosyltransferase family 4 protein [Steroidobacteraceae bacterium]|nr:glycosyltransferase family 4 protein [Steroidobacteraceae bacterium]
MSARALEFLIPGDLQSPTGGYVYDRMMVAGLRALGWHVHVHELDASFPSPTSAALAHAEHVLAALPERACALIDGLALGAMPQLVAAHSRRLHLIGLIHMPLGSELGIGRAEAERRQGEEQRALKQVDHVIVTSRSTEQELAARGIDRSVLSVVEPGAWTNPIGDRRRGRLGRPDDGILELLCVATIQEGKGHSLLMEALAPLAHLPWRLQCVGSLSRSPDTVRRLEDQMRDLRLIDHVSLVGELPHEALSDRYLAADLFVLPTLRESYGMAVAESLAHGVPVVSSRTGAIPELVGAEAGLLLEPGDRDALRAALEQALTDSALRSSMRRAALAAQERLTFWPQASERMARILERVCEAARTGER